ncbi:hypothetical protein N7509_000170 [Penicillium cosmopolitanum]|uniref:Uncharacterized protein n=1 Tax=Penicillium cosmopolitanum TaxID=1131564 RepID=A0A9W9WCE5_9EURO|nr:uncharacterized protein N7509_000170 [Penicillium cosmopolitanum]KAJ5414836.1 hypothetical protein N7509_000170 [Penicillium cosmopolitanum]
MKLSLQICIGVLAALSSSANGLVFRDRLTQDVDGTTLNLVHGIQGEEEVTFDVDAHSLQFNAWEFNTEGQPDTDAVIRPINSPATLVCREGSICSLDLNGEDQQVYRIDRISGAIFSFQDTASSLYISRTSDLRLELSPELTEDGYFTMHKITASEL